MDWTPDWVDRLTDQFKAGFKTSEFWLALVAVVYNAATNAIDPSRPFKEQVPGIVFGTIAAVYVWARTSLKGKRVTAVKDLAQTISYDTDPAPSPLADGYLIDEDEEKTDTDEAPPVDKNQQPLF